MGKMGFSIFTDGYYSTDVVAPKSVYKSPEDFIAEAKAECDGFEWEEKVTIENVKSAWCRYYPVSPEGCDIDGGCYALCPEGRGAFEVWHVDLQDRGGRP